MITAVWIYVRRSFFVLLIAFSAGCSATYPIPDHELIGCWAEYGDDEFRNILEIQPSGKFRQVVSGLDVEIQREGSWRQTKTNETNYIVFEGIILNYLSCSRAINQCDESEGDFRNLWQWQPTEWPAIPEKRGIPGSWKMPINDDEGFYFSKASCPSGY